MEESSATTTEKPLDRSIEYWDRTGLVVGLGGALAGARLLEAFLWEASLWDPLTYFGGAFFLLAVVLAASDPQGRRAILMAPARALRAE